MFRYFITTPDVGHYLVDKFNDTIQPHRERAIEPFLRDTGALADAVHQARYVSYIWQRLTSAGATL